MVEGSSLQKLQYLREIPYDASTSPRRLHIVLQINSSAGHQSAEIAILGIGINPTSSFVRVPGPALEEDMRSLLSFMGMPEPNCQLALAFMKRLNTGNCNVRAAAASHGSLESKKA
jgi:hypothetical protein